MALLLRDIADDLKMSEEKVKDLLLDNGIELETVLSDETPRREGAEPSIGSYLAIKNPREYFLWRARQWFEQDARGEQRIGGHHFEHTPFVITSEELGLPSLEISRRSLSESLEEQYVSFLRQYLIAIETRGQEHGT